MARPSSKDPLDKFRWLVEIDGFTRLGFTSVSIPSLKISIKNYPEGGNHLFPLSIVDSVNFEPITLTRGVMSDLNFQDWIQSYYDLITKPPTKQQGTQTTEPQNQIKTYKKEVIIKHLDRTGRPVKKYIIKDAFPIEYKPADDFASDTDDTYSLEKLVLAHEGFEVESLQESYSIGVNDIVRRLSNKV